VVSDEEKVLSKNQVTMQETTEKEPLMKCRKYTDDVKTGKRWLTRDKSERHLSYCSGGIRHKGGVTCIEALTWNIGTCRPDAKGKVQTENLQE